MRGVWLDGTFGAGGYARALLDAGAARVIGVDRDPEALERAVAWAGDFGDRLVLREGRFGELDRIAAAAGAPALDGVVLDIGVSSMQLDQPARGFSFLRDGPLDMRMSRAGPSAADLVNRLPEAALADLLFQLGEERAARRIARAIVADRRAAPFETTLQLRGLIERLLPRPKPGQPHAATRSFQALRIAVNDELGELARGLAAAEAALGPGGWLAVVTFHSLEDRIVKRYLRSARARRRARAAMLPETAAEAARFALVTRKAVAARRGRGRGQPARPLRQAPDRAAAGGAGRRGRPAGARRAGGGAGGAGVRFLLHVSAAVLVVVCATWAYRVNYATQEALNRVADLRGEIAARARGPGGAERRMGLPEPPRPAARRWSPPMPRRWGSAELTPDQFGETAMVAYPPEPDDLLRRGRSRAMIRRPLRPLARILKARAEGKDPNLIEAEERAARLAARHRAERVKAETRLLLLGVVFILGFSTVAGRMALVAATVPVEPRAGPGEPIHTQRADIVDRNGAVLATNIVTASLYAQPARDDRPARRRPMRWRRSFRTSTPSELYGGFTDGRKFIWIKRSRSRRSSGSGCTTWASPGCCSARARRGSIRTARWRRMCSAARATGARAWRRRRSSAPPASSACSTPGCAIRRRSPSRCGCRST